jgi:hypothetical protein
MIGNHRGDLLPCYPAEVYSVLRKVMAELVNDIRFLALTNEVYYIGLLIFLRKPVSENDISTKLLEYCASFLTNDSFAVQRIGQALTVAIAIKELFH